MAAALIDAFATQARFTAHVAPVWAALAPDVQGAWNKPAGRPVVVASYGDLRRIRTSHPPAIALMEHGAGQSYAGAGGLGTDHPSYPGGRDHADVGLYLVPNDHAGQRWLQAYPHARVEVVGCPKLDALPARVPGPGPVVAVSFHGTFAIAPETRSAFPTFAQAVASLAKHYRVIGHGHPLHMAQLTSWYRRHGIEPVDNFEEVCRRADLYACDNSSTLFEFASTGRPVVVLNAPFYRRGVEHGLRYWRAADVGVQCSDPAWLEEAVDLAITDPPEQQASRREALGVVYSVQQGAAHLAAAALADWATGVTR